MSQPLLELFDLERQHHEAEMRKQKRKADEEARQKAIEIFGPGGIPPRWWDERSDRRV